MNNHPYDVILELKRTPSRLKKLEILKIAIKDHPCLLKTFVLAYHPGIRFHIKKIPEYHHDNQNVPKTYLECLSALNNLSARTITGHNAINYLASLLSSTDEKSAKLLELVIQKDLDCGVTTKTINKISPNLIPEYPVMLCTAFSEKELNKFKWPAIAQPKHDGMRINFHIDKQNKNTTMYVRKGTTINDVPVQFQSLYKHIKEDCVLDGELLVLSEDGTRYLSRKEGNGILNSLNLGTASESEKERVTAIVWDYIPLCAFWTEEHLNSYSGRFQQLCDLKLPQSISVIEHEIVKNIQEAKEYYLKQLSLKREGAILKNPDSIWQNGRPKHQLKFKDERTMEMEIIDMIEGKGKYKGMLGALKCRKKDITVNVSGFTDNQRKEFWKRNLCGMIATVEYNEIIKDSKTGKKSLYLPRFLELREDI